MSNYDSRRKEDSGTTEAHASSVDYWKGPFAETDKYGQLTGSHYVVCRECGVEAVTSRRDDAEHRDDCPHRDETRADGGTHAREERLTGDVLVDRLSDAGAFDAVVEAYADAFGIDDNETVVEILNERGAFDSLVVAAE